MTLARVSSCGGQRVTLVRGASRNKGHRGIDGVQHTPEVHSAGKGAQAGGRRSTVAFHVLSMVNFKSPEALSFVGLVASCINLLQKNTRGYGQLRAWNIVWLGNVRKAEEGM